MHDILTESGQFHHGILHEGHYHRDFILEEEIMRHTLSVANDLDLDRERLCGDEKKQILPDEDYYTACLLAKRLRVVGIDKVTPEQVERLSRQDGRLLLALSAQLDQRRELFRATAEAPPERHPGYAQAGFPGGGDHHHEPEHDA